MSNHQNMVASFLKKTLVAVGGAVGAWAGYSLLGVDHDMPLPPAIDAPQIEFHGANSTFLTYYADTTAAGRPLLLLHSINAAASSYEMRPIFEYYRAFRPVYALDLPGFGFSERSDRDYSPQLYKAAILDMLDHFDQPVDVIALSLTCEFAAMAAVEKPDAFNSLTMISPTGLTPRNQKPTSQSARENDTSDSILNTLQNPLWSQPLYDLLVTKMGLRFFLGLNFDGKPDEGLVEYDYKTSHQKGARYAPLYFVSGLLFSPDIFDAAYLKVQVPTRILYDRDPNVSFDLLAVLLERNANFTARRIPNTNGLPQFQRLDKLIKALDDFWAELG